MPDDELQRLERDEFGTTAPSAPVDLTPKGEDVTVALAARISALERLHANLTQVISATIVEVFKTTVLPKVVQKIDLVSDTKAAELEATFSILLTQVSARVKKLESDKDVAHEGGK
jgi:Mn-dependent DtxR family transcriptional regulator